MTTNKSSATCNENFFVHSLIQVSHKCKGNAYYFLLNKGTDEQGSPNMIDLANLEALVTKLM